MRKLAHLTEYMIFSLLLYHSFAADGDSRWNTKKAFWAVIVAALYSLGDEFHQFFVPGRTSSIIDSGIDTAGATFGMFLLYAFGRSIQAKRTGKAVIVASADER